MLRAEDLFHLDGNPYAALFEGCEYVWDALKNLKSYFAGHLAGNVAAARGGSAVLARTVILYEGAAFTDGFEIDSSGKTPRVIRDGRTLPGASILYAGASLMDDAIQIGAGTVIEPGALIKGPTIIGDNTEVRQGAYIRGEALIGHNCVVGHTTEIKSSVMLGGSKAGHFAYIGDSILGAVNLGAGTKLANLKMIDSPINITVLGVTYTTGLRKFGAILADGVETGCNSVTTPGTILSKNVLLYPNGTARGYYPPDTVIQVRQDHQQIPNRFA